jgi:hypothetical protein
MAYRPDPSKFDQPLSRDDVETMRKHLSGIDPFRVQRAYQQAYEKCRLHGDVLPKASAIQELVIAWKVLRARRRARPERRD